MSLTCRIYLYLDEQAARFERDAELAAKPADRLRLCRIAAAFEEHSFAERPAAMPPR